ncbi:MAG TPA: hypothetical protein VFI82_00090 [Terriglobales bacterium]|nr:hypothetical protein [Terriglobales bacterium]
MRKMMACAVMAVVMLGVAAARAQEKEDAKKPAATESKPLHFYRLDFTFRELQDKKTVNARNYTMLLADNGVMSILKSGARIPVPSGNIPGPFQYIDVGVNLRCRVRNEEPTPLLVATIEFSSPALPEQGSTATQMAREQPVLRQANADVYAPIVSGKGLVIATMDDPSLPRRFEIEVTPTQLK